MFLSYEQYWRTTVREEIHALISKHASGGLPSFSGENIVDVLSTIPLSAWENEMPQLDRCIRETLRRSQPHTAVRKNMGPELTFGSYTVPSGSYVIYPFSDTLLNPNVYEDPLRWNPAREAVKEEAFIGWGGGKHMCKGQRLATLTMKLAVAYSLLMYDMDIVDTQGDMLDSPPVPDWNDFLTCSPMQDCRVRFSKRLGWGETRV